MSGLDVYGTRGLGVDAISGLGVDAIIKGREEVIIILNIVVCQYVCKD